MSILITILAFSMLIIIHELGHFFAAKFSKVQVNEFWLGMGPCIFQKEFKGTVYKLNLLPFGGAVVMEGEDTDSKSEHSFAKAKKINKALIMGAGCFMNFLLGFIIVFSLSGSYQSTTIDTLAEGFSYYGENGFLEGDKILSVDGHDIYNSSDFIYALGFSDDTAYDFVIERNGTSVKLSDFTLVPEELPINDTETQLRYGFNFTIERLPILDRIQSSYNTCVDFVKLVIDSLKDLFTGKVSVNDMSGVVGLTVMMGQVAETSMTNLWTFIAFISINLGVMNLLPLPALDGGRLVLLALEAIRKKPLNAKLEGIIHGAGLLILLGLMVYVTIHDIFVKLAGGYFN